MRDCAERNSQPAGPARCLGDCKLSLRMQTDKQDRHHLPVLPSTAQTVARASPSVPPPPTSPRRSIVRPSSCPPTLFHPCTRMFMNSLICFCCLPGAAAPPLSGRVSPELLKRFCGTLSPLLVQRLVASWQEVKSVWAPSGVLPVYRCNSL